ncbi:hypothetical protein [Rhodococcus globerulus]|uniref:Uncharacterized protein n=1 Tax=Rhodococcus globerulus TaxID=33008 RepID=A0ABU4BS86_RHOGO|nr:hypothetical protein [Rhodococcus globerulus]MDV6267087.1 hypothetical protein [Rhodococcus globerulus]
MPSLGEISMVVSATFTGISGIILASVKWQADKVVDQKDEIIELKGRVESLETQQALDHSRFRDAIRDIRARVAHALELAGLLHAHAPHVPIPPAPDLPSTIRDEV